MKRRMPVTSFLSLAVRRPGLMLAVSLMAGMIGSVGAIRTVGAAEPDPRGVAFFEKAIRPVLATECYQCHSNRSGKTKGGLVLDSEAGLLTGGESGSAVVPGSPAKSLLLEALRHEGLEMPPEKKLSDTVISDFTKWIRMGAPYPTEAAAEADWAAKKDVSAAEAREFWSFQPVCDHQRPAVKDGQWPRNELDYFVLARQEAAGLRPVADADPRTLVRRLYFDLIGLPPTPEQIREFERLTTDNRAAAVERLVDELLKSPRFGEHWGRHWLDVARFAESNGNVDNETFPQAWRYRNWVIDSFNNDKPWDRFLTEQLAGDLLPADSPARRNEQLTATGFLALTSKPRPQNNPEYQLDLVAEQIDTVTMAFMAFTVGCARCHDHKFDPIPTSEYYQMAAIFESTEMMHGASGKQGNNVNRSAAGNLLPLVSLEAGQAEAIESYERRRSDLETQLVETRRQIQQLTGNKGKAPKLQAVPKVKPAQKAKANQKAKAQQKAKPGQKAKAQQQAENQAMLRKLAPDDRAKLVALRQSLPELQSQLDELEKQAPPVAGYCMGVRDKSKPVEGQVRLRGESAKIGDAVPRGFTSIGFDGEPPRVAEGQSGRLELAQWMASPSNTFTSRVAVNRIWRHLFGTGIVKTVDNFGHLGEVPANPELLDHLASRFVREQWSVKRLIRAVVLSRTYQLASDHDAANADKDPDNVSLWRHNVRRLEAEPLRDALLLVAGNLDTTPPESSVVEKTGSVLIQNANQREFSQYEHAHRSVYLPIVRSAEPEMLRTFDLPDPELVVGDRSFTNVPAQSLFLMNSPFMVKQSESLASRVMAAAENDHDRIDAAFWQALGRPATVIEQANLGKFLAARTAAGGQDTGNDPASGTRNDPAGGTRNDTARQSAGKNAWVVVCQTLLASAEFRYIE